VSGKEISRQLSALTSTTTYGLASTSVVNHMKLLVALFVLLLSTLPAQCRQPQCIKSEFSGVATQSQTFRQELGQGIRFTVGPMTLEPDARWRWFQVVVIKEDEGVYVFNLSDTNWLLTTDFWSAFIGGANLDLKAALGYRLRYLIFPVSSEDKERLREAVDLIRNANTPDQIMQAARSLKSIPLGQLRFEIADYGVTGSDPPTSVDWVRFSAIATLPPNFVVSGTLPTTLTACPAIPNEVIQNIRRPNRHEYLLHTTATTAVER
jgi:hypothetical protein